MASHDEWRDEIQAKHNTEHPFSPENGQELKFKAGDEVTFTNYYGVSFDLTVTGLYQPSSMDALYAMGYRYLVNSSSPWMPVKESALKRREISR
jgi:hypothetical protein